MSIKKFALVTTALIGLYDASASFATDAREEIENIENRIKNLKAKAEIIKQNREKAIKEDCENLIVPTAPYVLYVPFISYNPYAPSYKNRKDVVIDPVDPIEKIIDSAIIVDSNNSPQQSWLDDYEKRVNTLEAYNNSWKKYFKDNVVSGAKRVGKVFGGLFN